MTSNETQGEIITFYSYKGGTGRSMAMSNVACLLAKRKFQSEGVLMIDWDLEAPGLHKYFHNKFTQLPAREIENKQGLIDLFVKLDKATPGSGLMTQEYALKIARNALDGIELDEFIVKTDIPNLSLLKAGRIDNEYSHNVSKFDWEGLYNRSPLLIRSLSERLAEKYSYVLIDSRTGYTDIGGICTMLMPQKLVVVFTPNSQSYDGIKELVKRATEYRRQSPDLRPLIVFPLPSRIEFSRDDLRNIWRKGEADRNIEGYQPIFEELLKEIYELPECNLKNYFDEVQIQQSPDYAYGEEIAVEIELNMDRFSLTKSYQTFTDWLVNSASPWQRIKKYDIFLSFAEQDRNKANVFAEALDRQGWTVWWNQNVFAKTTYDSVMEKALDNAKCIIVLWSNDSVNSDLVRSEAKEGLDRNKLLQVLIDDVKIPLRFRRIDAARIDWQETFSHPQFNQILDSVAKIASRSTAAKKREILPASFTNILLEENVYEFNKSRSENPDVKIDLHGENLAGLYLSGVNLSGADLSRADLSKAVLSDADLSDANLLEAKLAGVNLSWADLSKADLSGADLLKANLVGSDLSEANLTGTNLSETNLSNVYISGANLSSANLSGADLSNSVLIRLDLSWANLFKVNLSGADLSEVNLQGANLFDANLTDVKLKNANLYNANISNANLTDADLTDAILTNAVLTGANLSNANLSGSTLSNSNLTNASLIGVNLSRAILSEANLSDTDLSNANLSNANLHNSILTNTNLTNVNLSFSNLSEGKFLGAMLSGANIIEADLKGADLSDANLSGSDLSNAILTDANLNSSILTNTNLNNANLSRANFTYTNLLGANLYRADLSRAIFIGAILTDANFNEANLSNVYLSKADLSGLDLSQAKLTWADLSKANLSKTNLCDAKLQHTNLSGAILKKADLSGSDISLSNFFGTKTEGVKVNAATKTECIKLSEKKYVDKYEIRKTLGKISGDLRKRILEDNENLREIFEG